MPSFQAPTRESVKAVIRSLELAAQPQVAQSKGRVEKMALVITNEACHPELDSGSVKSGIQTYTDATPSPAHAVPAPAAQSKGVRKNANHYKFLSKYLQTSFRISSEIPPTKFSIKTSLSKRTVFTGQPSSINSCEGFMLRASAIASIVSAEGNFD